MNKKFKFVDKIIRKRLDNCKKNVQNQKDNLKKLMQNDQRRINYKEPFNINNGESIYIINHMIVNNDIKYDYKNDNEIIMTFEEVNF